MNYSNSRLRRILLLLAVCTLSLSIARAEEVGDRWGTEEREREYYPIVNVPIPHDLVLEAGAFACCPTIASPSARAMAKSISSAASTRRNRSRRTICMPPGSMKFSAWPTRTARSTSRKVASSPE